MQKPDRALTCYYLFKLVHGFAAHSDIMHTYNRIQKQNSIVRRQLSRDFREMRRKTFRGTAGEQKLFKRHSDLYEKVIIYESAIM